MSALTSKRELSPPSGANLARSTCPRNVCSRKGKHGKKTHEPYSGRDGAPPPSAQRNGRTVNSVALRHRGRGRRRSAVPTLTGLRESLPVNFDAHCNHQRAVSEYLAP